MTAASCILGHPQVRPPDRGHGTSQAEASSIIDGPRCSLREKAGIESERMARHHDAAGLARKKTAAATSSGSARRPIGVMLSICALARRYKEVIIASLH